MDKDEKVDFILEQMRLCLAKKDYVRTQIISKKISTRFFIAETGPVQVGVASQHGRWYLHYIMLVLHVGGGSEVVYRCFGMSNLIRRQLISRS